MKPTRPLLRYHGGKWRLALWIISHFPHHRRYVECYGGGGSVLLRKPRSYAEVYNDLFDTVVNLFRVMRDPAQAELLIRALRHTPYARVEFEQAAQGCADPVESARRMLVRSYMGFGSGAGSNTEYQTGFRSNSDRSGTTPAHDWMHFPDNLPAILERLQGVVIESRPALDVLRKHDSLDTLHYVDPPYPHSTRNYKTAKSDQVYQHEMTDADHEELLQCLLGLSGMVALSSYPNALYERILRPAGWEECRRATHADGARDRVEVLWLSPTLQAARGPRCLDILEDSE